jgi:hypothetical protein
MWFEDNPAVNNESESIFCRNIIAIGIYIPGNDDQFPILWSECLLFYCVHICSCMYIHICIYVCNLKFSHPTGPAIMAKTFSSSDMYRLSLTSTKHFRAVTAVIDHISEKWGPIILITYLSKFRSLSAYHWFTANLSEGLVEPPRNLEIS